jgi:hypothetical protein
MSDGFERHIPKQFPSMSNGDSLDKPWHVVVRAETAADPMEAIREAVQRMRASFGSREAVERDLRAARAALREVNAIKAALEKTIEELSRAQALINEVD